MAPQVETKSNSRVSALSEVISGFFEKIEIRPDRVDLTYKKQEQNTVCSIDHGKPRQAGQGEVIQLKAGQSVKLIQMHGSCEIVFVKEAGLAGLAALRITHIPPEKVIQTRVAAKADLVKGGLIETADEEHYTLLKLAGIADDRKPIIRSGLAYQRSDIGTLLSDFFKKVEVSEDRLVLQFKDAGTGYVMSLNGGKERRAEYGETIRLEPGQTLKLIERHGSLRIFMVNVGAGVEVAIVSIGHSPREDTSISIATGRIDNAHGKLVEIGKNEEQELLRKTGIVEDGPTSRP